jgi:hypothetical protein
MLTQPQKITAVLNESNEANQPIAAATTDSPTPSSIADAVTHRPVNGYHISRSSPFPPPVHALTAKQVLANDHCQPTPTSVSIARWPSGLLRSLFPLVFSVRKKSVVPKHVLGLLRPAVTVLDCASADPCW